MQAQFMSQSEFLIDCIGKLRKRYTNYSFQQIANQIDITDSTLGRIESGETKKPSFKNAIKIIREAAEKENLRDFIVKSFPQMLQEYDDYYSIQKDSIHVSAKAETLFKDPIAYELMIIAATRKGLTREGAMNELGRRGAEQFDRILESGFLVKEGEKYIVKGPVNASQDVVKSLAHTLIHKNYDDNLFGTGSNYLTVQYQSKNKELVLPKIRETLKETAQKVWDILKDPSTDGDDVVWVVLALDKLIGSGMMQKDSVESSAGVMQ